MIQPLPSDVTARVRRDFGERAGFVKELLLNNRRVGVACYLSDRLLRCVVFAARGDESRIQSLLELAQVDFRDVIVAGEYEGAGHHVRDLRYSFLIDSPEKYWIIEVAGTMSARGYELSSLDCRPTTNRPFECSSGLGEGIAVFFGPMGEMKIEKKDGKWILHRDAREVEVHQLDKEFEEEVSFPDILSGFLLAGERERGDVRR